MKRPRKSVCRVRVFLRNMLDLVERKTDAFVSLLQADLRRSWDRMT
jgi:hypothetical protein